MELSPGKAQISTEHFNFSREETSKNPLTNIFSAAVAISKESKATTGTFAVKERKKLPPLQEKDSLSEQTR